MLHERLEDVALQRRRVPGIDPKGHLFEIEMKNETLTF